MDLATVPTPQLQASYRKILQEVDAGRLTRAQGVADRAPMLEELTRRGEGTHPDCRPSTPESKAKAQTVGMLSTEDIQKLQDRIAELENEKIQAALGGQK